MRNQEICQLYLDGVTQAELAERYSLSIGWIGHILRKAGIKRIPIPRTDRVAFTGVFLSTPVKEALKIIVKEERTSMSRYIANLVKRDLKEQGVVINDTIPNEKEPPLPYETTDPDVHG